MADDEQDLPLRKGNRAHKLRRRRKVEDNPMSGSSLRHIYPAVVHRRLKDLIPRQSGDKTPIR